MKYLVTGGAGFIGSAIVRALLAENEEVRVVDNFATGHRANLAGLDGVEVVEGDLRDPAVAQAACRGIEVVFHEAAVPSVPKSVLDPWLSHTNNLDASLQVLLAARDQGVRRLVYAASSSAYGNTAVLPKVETMPAAPLSPYAVAKYGVELYARVFSELYHLETISLRYFNIFGPRQDPASPYSGVISRFISLALAGQTPVIYGDGQQSRDFTFVANAVAANLLARTAGTPGAVYNVGTGERSTLLQVLQTVADILEVKIAPRFEPERQGDVRDSLADIRRARQELGYAPQVKLREGLEATVAWCQTPSGQAATRGA